MGIILFTAFGLIGTRISRASEKQLSELLIREQVLQAKVVRNSINERIQRLVSESGVLASYSFPEYMNGLRSRQSMENLFISELEAYIDTSCYSFLDFTGNRSIFRRDDDPQGKKALEAARQWESEYPDVLGNYNIFPVIPQMVTEEGYIFIGLIYPVYIGGEIKGMLTAVVDLNESFFQYINPVAEDFSGTAYVVDDQMRIIWSSQKGFSGYQMGEIYKGLDEQAAKLAVGGAEETEGVLYFDAVRLGTSSRERFSFIWSGFSVSDRGINIVLINRYAFLKELLATQQNQRLFLYVSLFFLVFLIIFWVFRWRLLAYRNEVTESSRILLAELVRKKTEELNNLYQRYSNLYEKANDAIVLIVDGRIVDCNKKALESFGTDKNGITGSGLEALSPDIQPDLRESRYAVEEILERSRNMKPQLFYWRFRRFDGSEFDAEVSLSSMELEDRILVQAIIRDITDRMQSLREKEVMLKEIHHRVKNNLQIIDSLLYLQTGKLKNREAVAAVNSAQRRIDAMAKIHEMLHLQENLSMINASVYLLDLIQYFNSVYIPDVVFRIIPDLEEMFMEIDQCMYTGIIMSELIDNSIRHAAINGKELVIKAELRTTGGRFSLKVSDNGTGFEPTSDNLESGIGLQLVYALAEQIGGEFRFTRFENGISAELECSVVSVS